MKKQRILLSSILTLFMFFSMFSFSVFADDRQQETETTEEPEQELTEDVPQTVNEESSNVSAGDSDSAESEEIIDDDNEISVTAEDILPDNDSLLEQYLNQALPHEEIQFRKKAAGDTLPGLNALLYQNLKQERTQHYQHRVAEVSLFQYKAAAGESPSYLYIPFLQQNAERNIE